MRIKKAWLKDLGVSDARATRYLPELRSSCEAHGIDTPLRVAHFLSQVLHESARMRAVEENLNYSADALLKVFKKYFPTRSSAEALARKPKRIASRVYAGRMGNGDEASGEGYRYRGRGLIQLTGKSNYRKFSDWIGQDVVPEPDLVASKFAVQSAVFYWTRNAINALADIDDVKRVTKKINGGFNGLADRVELLDRTKELLKVDAEPVGLERATHTVKATKLNLRNRPETIPATRIGSLDQGAEVMKLADARVDGWVKVRAVLGGQISEGFVAERFLEPAPPVPVVSPPAPVADVRIAGRPHGREPSRYHTRSRRGTGVCFGRVREAPSQGRQAGNQGAATSRYCDVP